MNKNNIISKLYPLEGQRILITAWDLEQEEHRGIAMYSKNLLQSLKSLGAEVWVLTGLSSDTPFRTRYIEEKKKIEITRILGQLSDSSFHVKNNLNFLKNIYLSSNKFLKIITLIKFLPEFLFSFLNFNFSIRYKIYERKYFKNNPLLKTSKLNYFKNIDGIISAKNIYEKASISAILNTSPVKIKLKKFDAFVTTCPLCIKVSNNIKTIQTIHDLIPISIPSQDDPTHFFRRLALALKTDRRIYISSFTKSEYEYLFYERFKNIKYTNHSRIIIQPPSLTLQKQVNKVFLDEGSLDDKNINSLIKIKYFEFGNKNLTSNEYILFNSSIEPRKNLELALDVFCDYLSLHKDSTFKFCVIGKLKSDEYCRKLKNRFNDENIIFTGYIDEKIKLLLYLNSRAFISTSFIEGFGIPVLDAACMGINSLVSNIKPHQEISNLKDFNKYIDLIPLTTHNSWLDKLENIFENEKYNSLNNKEKYKRLKRYYLFKEQINDEFNCNIQKIIEG